MDSFHDSDRLVVRCDDCGRRYRVRAGAARTLRCKECGGAITIPAAGEDSPVGPSTPEGSALPASSSPTDAEPDGARRREAARDLQRAYRTIRRVRFLYSTLAFLSGYASLVLVATAIGVSRSPQDFPEDSSRILWVATALSFAVTGLLVTAAARVRREPFAWGLIVALLQTLSVVLGTLRGEVSLFAFALLVLFWTALIPLVRLRALVQEHPDLYVSRRIRGEARRRPEGESVRERAAQRRAAEAASRRTLLLALGGTLAAAVLLFFGWKFLNRPPLLEQATPSLVEAWNRSDVDAVAALWRDSEKARRSLERLLSARDWERLPTIERDELDPSRGSLQLATTAEGDFEFHWRLSGDRWILVGMRVP